MSIQEFFSEFAFELVIAAAIGIFLWFRSLLFDQLPKRVLWKLNNPHRVRVVLSTSFVDSSEGYRKPATGVGQVKAFAHISKIFTRAFPSIDFDQVFLSEEVTSSQMQTDLILLGGPHTNEITRYVLEDLKENAPVSIGAGNSLVLQDETIFTPVINDESVVKDYGVILACPNPYNSRRRALLFFGSHTFGTEAATQYYSDGARITCELMAKYFITIVECDVLDDRVRKFKQVYFKKLSL